jgi:hypothetical protein
MTTTTWQYYVRNLSVETIKCKRTFVWWLAAGAPLFNAFIAFNVFYFKGHEIVKPGQDPWPYLMGNVLQIWSMLFFPLTIALQSALYPAIEHQSNTWKHVYSLAVPRWSVYAGKLTLFTALVALTMVLMFALTEAVGALLGGLRPELGFSRHAAHAVLARECSRLLLAALGIAAIQFYVGFRFRNFVLPAGFGLLMTVASVTLMRWEHIYKFPYAWPMLTWLRRHVNPAFFTTEIVLSLLVFAIVALFGYFETARRDVA